MWNIFDILVIFYSIFRWWENVSLLLHSRKKHVIWKIPSLTFLYFKAKLICCKIDLKYNLAAKKVEIISFFLRLRKLRVKTNKKKTINLFCYLMLFINNKLLKNMHSFNFVFEVKYLRFNWISNCIFYNHNVFKASLSRLTKLLISALFHANTMLSITWYVVTLLWSEASPHWLTQIFKQSNLALSYYKNLFVYNYNFLPVSKFIFLFTSLRLCLDYPSTLNNFSLYILTKVMFFYKRV